MRSSILPKRTLRRLGGGGASAATGLPFAVTTADSSSSTAIGFRMAIKAAHSPARRCCIAGLHPRVVNLLLDGRAVDVQRRARAADLGDLEHRPASPKLVADAQLAAVQPAGGKVLAERAVEHRIPAGF